MEISEHFLRGGQRWHRASRDWQGVLYFLWRFHENISTELYQKQTQSSTLAGKCQKRKNVFPLAQPPLHKRGKERRQSLKHCPQNISNSCWCWVSPSIKINLKQTLIFPKCENDFIWTDRQFFFFPFSFLFLLLNSWVSLGHPDVKSIWKKSNKNLSFVSKPPSPEILAVLPYLMGAAVSDCCLTE